jgi:hypothetical protein
MTIPECYYCGEGDAGAGPAGLFVSRFVADLTCRACEDRMGQAEVFADCLGVKLEKVLVDSDGFTAFVPNHRRVAVFDHEKECYSLAYSRRAPCALEDLKEEVALALGVDANYVGARLTNDCLDIEVMAPSMKEAR